MANKERGEFRLVAGESRYVLRLTTNATCELEDFSGRLWDHILLGANRGSVRDVRLILWAALREHHPDLATDDKESLKAVGRLVDDAGGLPGILVQIRAFIALNADTGEPDEKGGAAKGGAAKGGAAKAGTRPLHAQAGTGESSIPSLLVSV